MAKSGQKSKKQFPWLVLVLGVLALISALVLAYGSPQENRAQAADVPLTSLSVNTAESLRATIPDLTLTSLTGEQVSLSDFSGQVVVVNFWATWCPPCRREMPDLAQLHLDYADEDVVVLAINAGEGREQVAPFAAELGLPFDVLLDHEMSAMTAFNVVSLPTTFFINRDGTINHRYSGMLTRPQMDQQVVALQ